MDTFKRRFVSGQNILYVFAACIFFTHVWGIINLFQMVPAWMLRLSNWDLIGVVSYVQVYLLLESVILLVVLLIIGAILPGRLLRNKFVALSMAALLLGTLWVLLFQYNTRFFLSGGMIQLLVLAGLGLLSFVGAYLLIDRNGRIEATINAFVQRIVVLSFLYVTLDIIGAFIVIVRNI